MLRAQSDHLRAHVNRAHAWLGVLLGAVLGLSIPILAAAQPAPAAPAAPPAPAKGRVHHRVNVGNIHVNVDGDTEDIDIPGVHINFDEDATAFFGIEGERAGSSLRDALGIEEGLRVVRVVPGSPAAATGVHRGDVITSMDTEQIGSMTDLGNFLSEREPHDSVEVHLIRRGQTLVLTGVLGGRFHRRHGGEDMVRFGEDIHIAAGQVVGGDVVSIGGSVTVMGQVEGQVVSVGGSVHVMPGGSVGGDVVSVMGTVKQDPGAQIQGQTIVVGGGRWGPGFNWSWWKFAARLGMLALFLMVLALVYALFRERFLNAAYHVSTHTVKAFLMGLLVVCTFIPVFVLLCITIIGIPLALGYALATFMALVIGYLAAALFLGKRLQGHSEDWSRNNLQAALLGFVVLQAFWFVANLMKLGPDPLRIFGFAVGVVGLILGFVAAMTGMGAIVVSRFSRPANPGFFGLPPSHGVAPVAYAPPPPPPASPHTPPAPASPHAQYPPPPPPPPPSGAAPPAHSAESSQSPYAPPSPTPAPDPGPEPEPPPPENRPIE